MVAGTAVGAVAGAACSAPSNGYAPNSEVERETRPPTAPEPTTTTPHEGETPPIGCGVAEEEGGPTLPENPRAISPGGARDAGEHPDPFSEEGGGEGPEEDEGDPQEGEEPVGEPQR